MHLSTSISKEIQQTHFQHPNLCPTCLQTVKKTSRSNQKTYWEEWSVEVSRGVRPAAFCKSPNKGVIDTHLYERRKKKACLNSFPFIV